MRYMKMKLRCSLNVHCSCFVLVYHRYSSSMEATTFRRVNKFFFTMKTAKSLVSARTGDPSTSGISEEQKPLGHVGSLWIGCGSIVFQGRIQIRLSLWSKIMAWSVLASMLSNTCWPSGDDILATLTIARHIVQPEGIVCVCYISVYACLRVSVRTCLFSW